MTTHPPLRRLIVCADDFGLSPAVSSGIAALAAAGRLSATGAMTCMPAWAETAALLRPLTDRLAVGLHFTLTDQRPLGALPDLAPEGRFPGIGRLLKQALSGRLPTAQVAAELDRQIDAFEAGFGRPPDFIDGHQHVHLLPGVRDAVLAAFDRRLDPARCRLRDCTDRLSALLRRPAAAKAAFIAALGLSLARRARSRGIGMNCGFSGFYDGNRQSLETVFPALLTAAGDGHLLMLHPGHLDDALRAVDSFVAPREREWAFLMSDAFPRLLEQLGFTIARGWG